MSRVNGRSVLPKAHGAPYRGGLGVHMYVNECTRPCVYGHTFCTLLHASFLSLGKDDILLLNCSMHVCFCVCVSERGSERSKWSPDECLGPQ